MCPGAMVVLDIRAKEPSEMTLVEHDDVVKHVAPERAYHSLRVRILPRRTWRSRDLVDTHAVDAAAKLGSIDAITVANHVSRRAVEREGFDHLLSGPRSRRAGRDIEVREVVLRQYLSALLTSAVNDGEEPGSHCLAPLVAVVESRFGYSSHPVAPQNSSVCEISNLSARSMDRPGIPGEQLV